MTDKTQGHIEADATGLDNAADAETQAAPVTEATPETQPQATHKGLYLDQHGLPVNGVARAKVLEALEADDPVIDPKAWAKRKFKADDLKAALEKIHG